MGSPGRAAVLPGQRIRPIPGVDRRRERPGESLWNADQMPRQRIHHTREAHDQRHGPGGRNADGFISGIDDADGLDNAVFSHQWIAGGSDIDGAIGSSYTVVDADEEKTIKVRVTFTDDGGNQETLTSEPTAAETRPHSSCGTTPAA